MTTTFRAVFQHGEYQSAEAFCDVGQRQVPEKSVRQHSRTNIWYICHDKPHCIQPTSVPVCPKAWAVASSKCSAVSRRVFRIAILSEMPRLDTASCPLLRSHLNDTTGAPTNEILKHHYTDNTAWPQDCRGKPDVQASAPHAQTRPGTKTERVNCSTCRTRGLWMQKHKYTLTNRVIQDALSITSQRVVVGTGRLHTP